MASGHHVLTLSFASHLVPLCMGPKLRTLARSLDWLHLLDCPTAVQYLLCRRSASLKTYRTRTVRVHVRFRFQCTVTKK